MSSPRTHLHLALRALFILWTVSAPLVSRAKTPPEAREALFTRMAQQLRESMRLETQTSSQDGVVNLFRGLDRNLPARQDQETSRYLHHAFGVEVAPERARAYVRELSAANLARLTSPGLSRGTDFAEIYRKLEPWFARYQHNMWMMASKADQQPYWLSSKQLESLGLKPGLQKAAFNKEFLGTQDWIFFLVNGDRAEEYGNSFITLDHAYAETDALISPYIMYPSDLAAFGLVALPNEARRLIRDLEVLYPQLKNEVYREESTYLSALINKHWETTGTPPWLTLESLARFRAEMIRYTFLPDDFRRLVAANLTQHFRARRLLHPIEAYQKELSRDLINQALKRAGLPSRFELRVPVAIPNPHLTFGGTCAGALDG